MKVAFYITATGEIDWVFDYPPEAIIPTDVDADLETGYSWKEIPATLAGADINMETHYVSGGVFTVRPILYADSTVMILANGGATADGKLEFAMLSGTKVYAHYLQTEYTSVAENFTFQSLRVGEWTFDFDPPFPQRPVTIEVTVNAL